MARNLGPTSVSSAAPAQNPSASAVVPGALLANKYRVERVLGQGGMGYVVEARHVALEERVALKFLLPEYAKHPEASARFLREARAAVKIKSEHVARVSDVGTLDSGAPYMVMEFLDGADLAQTLQKNGVLSVDDAIDYILQGCEAIAEAHSYGIVHRDLKPANLFLAKRADGSPLVKVLDFGISKVIGGGDHALTKTTTAMGSALYMSPEQMQETRGVDHRTDIYSMGIALFELLAGRQPFYAETLPQLCAEVLTGVPTPMSAYRPDIPADLANRLERAYERDKNRRYQSIAEFAVALAPYAPERSRQTIERLARMGGLAPPMRSENSSSNLRVVPTTAPIIVTSTAPPNTSPGAMAVTAGTDELPRAGFVEPMPPIPDLGSPHSEMRIEPGSYRAPISTNAAAAFASATKPGRPPTSGRKLLVGAMAISTVVVGLAIFALSYLRSQAQINPENQRVVGPVTPQSIQVVPVASTTTAPTPPPVVNSADKPPPPVEVPDAGPPVIDAGKLGGFSRPNNTTKPTPSAPPSSKPKNPNDYLDER
jgi:eukaryotic-like serine/threonine-protein kinase